MSEELEATNWIIDEGILYSLRRDPAYGQVNELTITVTAQPRDRVREQAQLALIQLALTSDASQRLKLTSLEKERWADSVYFVLIEEAGAPAGHADSFRRFILEGGDEFRFCGLLDFGGKFWPRRMAVTCYPENMNDERAAIIKRTNERLKALSHSEAAERSEDPTKTGTGGVHGKD